MRTQTLRLLQRIRAGAASGVSAGRAITPSSSTQQHALQAVRAFAVLAQQLPRQQQPFAGSFALSQAHTISTSSITFAEALTEVAVDGDVESLISEIDRVLSSESCGAKEVADAAVALTYLQAKGARRVWGKVFEKADALKGSFDAASLTNLLWAITTANVEHGRTVFELSGAVAAQLKSLTPTQVSLVTEALGKAGVKDVELSALLADQIVANIGSYKPAELARILWGFGAVRQADAKLFKAAGKALAGADLGAREASQALWGLANANAADKATLDGLVKTLKAKLGSVESGVDAAAAAFSLGALAYKADGATAQALAAACKAAAPELTPAQAINAAWGLGVIGAGDKDSVSALLSVAASAIEANPTSVDVYSAAMLYAASAMTPDAKLSPAVSTFALNMFNVANEHMLRKRSASMQGFKDCVAENLAKAFGARYRPEIAAAKEKFNRTTADGVAVELGVELDGTKLAFELVGPHYLSGSTVLGPALAKGKVLEAKGYKPVYVPLTEYAAQKDDKAKAKYLLDQVKAAVPGARVDPLKRKLDEPFDAYSD